MRIIAGDLKGRKLAMPKDSQIRPTTDKVKEALFSMLAPYIEDAIVIDLFAGTGGLGLEAISRGAKRVYFGDRARTSLTLTKTNIKSCKAEDKSVVLHGDWKEVLSRIPEPADIILLDPPYQAELLIDTIRQISEHSLLKNGGIIVAEHGTNVLLPNHLYGLEKFREKQYGTILITLFLVSLEE